MTDLGSAFIRLIGRAAEGLSNVRRMWCDLCHAEMAFKLVDESRGTETWKCTGCNIVTHSYTVK